MDDYDKVYLVLSRVIFWTSAFLLTRKIYPNRSFNICKRIISTIHAVFTVIFSSMSVQDWRHPVSPLASNSSPLQCGTEMVAILWITEVSSPFLHLRELLKDLGYKDTNLNLAAGVSFAVTYMVARMCFGTYLLYVWLFSSNYPILLKALGVGLAIVSTYWFYNIVRMVKYKLAKRSKFNQLALAH